MAIQVYPKIFIRPFIGAGYRYHPILLGREIISHSQLLAEIQ